ncbi:MAG TPA: TIM barrel protein [Solirubrobacteraceae bacterium]|nr:TIM barrel protein [Solirubrobacteraceae bacterium]
MRLASPLTVTWDDAGGWIETLRRHGFRTAFWPLPDDADAATVRAYRDAAAAADVVIAEVGAWHANPISPDDEIRKAGIARCQAQLALADEAGARCCVTTAGSRGDAWDAPHPDNLTPDTFDLVVDTVREIIDGAAPRRTFYTVEPMPWSFPDSPDSYLELVRAVDRKQFGVHLDPTNMISSPRRYFDNAGFLRECFAKLGPHIRSVHAKDIRLTDELTVHLEEVRPGLGTLDFAVLLTEMEKLDPDTPILVEHLDTEAEYEAAVAHVRGVAESLGLRT